MGCSGSKVDELPAVALCRERTRLIEEAVHQRYVLSAAHLNYIRSLRGIGVALEAFLSAGGDSPVLNLPPIRKADPIPLAKPKSPPPASPKKAHLVTHAPLDSDQHLHFNSDDDDDSISDDHEHLHHGDEDDDQHLHLQGESPSPPVAAAAYYPDSFFGGMPLQYGTTNQYNQYFMRSTPMPPVTYQHRPESPEKVNWGQSYANNTPNFGFTGFFGVPGGSFVSASSSWPPKPSPAGYPLSASSSSYAYEQNHSPPPPPPPNNSTWDFLNPFEVAYEAFYSSNSPSNLVPLTHSDGGSRDSREVREEEGIPDLEDEGLQEVVKEIHGEQKVSDGFAPPHGGYHQKSVQLPAEDMVVEDQNKGEALREGRSSADSEYEDDEVELVDKIVIEDNKSPDRGKMPQFEGPRDAIEAMRMIRIQFDRASDSGNEVSVILEAGRLPYRHKNAVYKVSAKMFGAIAPPLMLASLPSTSKAEIAQLPSSVGNPSPGLLDFEDDTWLRSCKLSSTLEKLFMWEKKLFEEVKAEEKWRVVHDRQRMKLNRMSERGSEAHKIEATRLLIRSLSTKIRIAIHFVNSVSTKINKLRDEELLPQITELIQGLMKMWKVMLECHQTQCRIILGAKNMDFLIDGMMSSESHMQATMQLELDLLNWVSSFYVWVAALKGYVRALNGWLVKGILYEPEETPDGVVPFSPGRLGAPPLFVICNRWCQVIEGISEREVVDELRTVSTVVFQLWQQHRKLQQHRLTSVNSPKDTEKGIKALQKDEQKIQKAWIELNRKLLVIAGDTGLPSTGGLVERTDSAGGINIGLKQIFDAMIRYSESSLRAYEEIDVIEVQTTREGEKIS